MKRTEQFFDVLFETVGNIIISFIRRVAPFATPAAPAYFFGHAVYSAVTDDSIAIFVGIVAALGLESAGILAAHYAVKFYGSGETRRGHVAAGGAAVYLLIGIAAIWLLDGLNQDAKLVGTAMFLVAGIVYLLTGLAVDSQAREQARLKANQETAESLEAEADRREQERQEADRKAQEQLVWERAQQERDREAERQARAEERRLRHEERMAEIHAAQAAPQILQATKPANASATHYKCTCGRVFDKPQSYSAHTRHCAVHRQAQQ